MRERAITAILDELGPVVGNPEYLAKPGNVERLQARQRRAAEKFADRALLAAHDPHDSELQNIILGAMGFVSDGPKNYSPMARVQAHDAIAALSEL